VAHDSDTERDLAEFDAMKVKLLRQHIIADTERLADEIIDVSIVTPFMEGLDPEAREAIRQEKIRVWGRWIRDEAGIVRLLDDPPIPRPIEEAQPVPHIPAQKAF
jgi:hypothetical protein